MIVGYLQRTSWEGFGGHHWYGAIHFKGRSRAHIHITRKLSDSEAKALNKKDRTTAYVAGFESERFEDERELTDAAIKAAKENGIDILIAGSTANCDPDPILHGPEPLMSELNAIQARCEEIGYWDHQGYVAEMQRLADKWEAKLKAVM